MTWARVPGQVPSRDPRNQTGVWLPAPPTPAPPPEVEEAAGSLALPRSSQSVTSQGLGSQESLEG